MTTYIALLRAVNVGGTGKLPMSKLKELCEAAGLVEVRTYIASGNVLFRSALSEAAILQVIQSQLQAHIGKAVGVVVRTAAELAAVLADNPYPEAPRNQVMAIFLEAAPPADALQKATGAKNERVAAGRRELYVHYGEGAGNSKLKIPAAKNGTARNMNTLAKLVELVS